MKNLFKNTANKISPTKEKNWTILLSLESSKNKNFQSPSLEIDFLIDSAAEKKNYNITT